MPLTLFNYIGTFLVGGTVALLLWAVVRTFKLRLASWVYPATIGATMIVFQIYNDYTWFDRTAGDLPPRIVVTDTYEGRSLLKIWTYALPVVDRFRALDRGSIKRNPAVPDLVIADVILVTRFQPTFTATQIFDCAANRRADAHTGITFDAEGRPENAEWVEVAADDALIAAACAPQDGSSG